MYPIHFLRGINSKCWCAKNEKAWAEKLQNRIVEEFLFQADLRDEDAMIDDEDDFESSREQEGDITVSPSPVRRNNKEEFDGPFGMPGDTIYAKDDIYLGGGNGGVFADYSESSTNASFSGQHFFLLMRLFNVLCNADLELLQLGMSMDILMNCRLFFVGAIISWEILSFSTVIW